MLFCQPNLNSHVNKIGNHKQMSKQTDLNFATFWRRDMSDESECRMLQDEEAEVLTSIYDGDPAFVTVAAGQKYQYKIGDPDAER